MGRVAETRSRPLSSNKVTAHKQDTPETPRSGLSVSMASWPLAVAFGDGGDGRRATSNER